MKRFFCSLLIVSIIAHCYAQDYTRNYEKAEAIKADEAYIYGEGDGQSREIAEKNALHDLLIQIFGVRVTGEVNTTVANEQDGQNVSSSVEVEKVVKTYTSGSLPNAEKLLLSDTPYHYLYYIKKSDVDKIFEERKSVIKEFTKVAVEALNENNIGEAIRHYYWANIMLNSLRPTDDLMFTFNITDSKKASIFVPQQLETIFTNIQAKVVGKQEDSNNYKVSFSYNERPVVSLDFRYYDGADWSDLISVRDGIALIELQPDYEPEQVKIEYEYQYRNESTIRRDVSDVLDAVDEINYRQAKVDVPLVKNILPAKISLTVQPHAVASSAQSFALPDSVTSLSNEAVESYKIAIYNVVDAIRKKNYASVETYFTPDGYELFNKLIAYGKAKVVDSSIDLSFAELNGYVTCRSVPMQFSFSAGRKFVENVVFVFDKSNKIDNISFGLSEVAKEDIFYSKPWSQQAKEVLASFLENYKTAYALKRADYLESIFADDALIIVGNVVEKLEGSPELGYQNNRYVTTTKVSKEEYIARLKNVFRYNEFVNIKFANNEVRKMGKGGEVYAIQIKQDYFSDNYGDSGYLFLMVDVNNPQQPIIHIRAWQEEPDPEWGLIGPEHF